MLETAVAFVIFNRPDSTAESFRQIRAAQPKHLFLISDGPRSDRAGEANLVAETRQVAEQVDWPCQVRKLYADKNMGCGRRISSGISQAMTEVSQLIVLEDDCIPDPSFFPYCQELLERYEDDDRVMTVTGNNFQQGKRRGEASYYFSKYPHCWGWATWRRAWTHFDLQMSGWPEFRDAGLLEACCSNVREYQYWCRTFDLVYEGKIDSWAIPWVFTCWSQHGLTAIPEVNLVTNIGFDERATHTSRHDDLARIPACSLDTIDHPEFLVRHEVADRYTDANVFQKPNRHWHRVKQLFSSITGSRRAA